MVWPLRLQWNSVKDAPTWLLTNLFPTFILQPSLTTGPIIELLSACLARGINMLAQSVQIDYLWSRLQTTLVQGAILLDLAEASLGLLATVAAARA